jgi:hypothetical protein
MPLNPAMLFGKKEKEKERERERERERGRILLCIPVKPRGRRSQRTRWFSVPSVTNL